VANDIGQHYPSRSESKRVISAQLHRPLSQSHGFGDFILGVDHPTVRLAWHVAMGSHCVGRGEVPIELDGSLEQMQRLNNGLSAGELMKGGYATQIIIIRAEALRRLAPNACYLDLL